MAGNTHNTHELTVKNVYLDTNQELVAYMPRDCYACRSEGFQSLTRLLVFFKGTEIIATLNITDRGLLKEEEMGLF